jgi:N-acetylglucosaminyl-diphospho-decaprenol L-rhamnosyltransferase
MTTPMLVTTWLDSLVFALAAAIAEAYCPPTQPFVDSGYGLGVSTAGRAANDNALVSVVVVTHNNRELIDDCLRAIHEALRRRETELIVVDNASTDGTREVIANAGWPVEVISMDENVGFAQAVNCALKRARGGFFALVNSDAFPDPGCIDELVDVLHENPQVGIVGARLRYPSGRLQPSAGTFPSLLGGLWVALFLHRVPGLSRIGIGYLADARLYRRARRVDWVCAAVCAARAELGPLPSSSFMYGEDVEWGLACRQAGLQAWLVPRATAVHIGRASVDQSQDASFAQRRRAQFELAWFARRGRLVALLARAVLLIHGVLRLIVYGALSVVRGRRDRRVAEYCALVHAALSAAAPAA